MDVAGDTMTGALTVGGTVTANDIAISDGSPTFTMTDTDTNALFRVSASSAVGSVTFEVDENGVGSNPQFLIQGQNVDRFRIDADSGDISFYEDTGTTAKFFWDASAESLGIGTTSPSAGIDINANGSAGTVGLHVNKDNSTGYFVRFEADLGTNNNRTLTLAPPSTDSSSEPFRWGTGNAYAFETDGTERLRINDNGIQVTGNITVTGTVDGRDIATNIPASLGTAGQVLSVNSGANAAEWADAASGGASRGFVYFMRG